MGWKSLSYWLKGGIIGILVVISLCLIGLLLGSNDLGFLSLAFIPLYPAYYLIILFFKISGTTFITTNTGTTYPDIPNADLIYFLWTPLLGLIIYFIIGALIGLIYSKLKSKKENKKRK